MDYLNSQLRKTLEDFDRPLKAIRESLRRLEYKSALDVSSLSALAAIGQREVSLFQSLADVNLDASVVARSLELPRLADLEKLTQPFRINKEALERLTQPFGMSKAELQRLTQPLVLRTDELSRFQDRISAISATNLTGIDSILGVTRERAEELIRSLARPAIADALSMFKWDDLRATIASAVDATDQEELQSAVHLALEESGADMKTSSGLGDFLQALLKVSGADGLGKLVVWFFVIEFLRLIISTASLSTIDYYVKDHLSKAAQAEDRRALAKEVATEIGKLGLAREYVVTRRYASSAMKVHINPKAKSPVVGSLRMGELVEVVRVDRDWTRIVFKESGKELSGWAYTRYLRTLPHQKSAVGDAI